MWNPRARLMAAIEPLEQRMLLTSIVVNTIADSTDAPGSTVISLRDAINIANKSTTATAITFSPTVFASAKTIVLNGNNLELSGTKPISITGPAAGVTVNGNQGSNDFQIDKQATASLSGMTLTGGNNDENGGGIENDGALTLSSVTLTGNHAAEVFGSGGGIQNNGTATLISCNISGNTGDYYGAGGGIDNNGTMTVTDCTISGNASGHSGDGGGINSAGPITLTGCTISGNTGGANGGGGCIELLNVATLTNCTIAANTDVGAGINFYAPPGTLLTVNDCTVSGNTAGGIVNYVLADPNGGANSLGGECDVANTIIAGNTAANDPDTNGAFKSLGFNLIGDVGDSTGWKSTDRTGTGATPLNADLGPLADNGGPTPTMLPLSGSPAIDHGSNALIPKGITTDQRGFARVVNGTVDIGAVELQNKSVISGSVFDDANGNARLDVGEDGLALWKVYLDLNNDGKLDAGDASRTTNIFGYFEFAGLKAGTYTLRIVPITGLATTTPAVGSFAIKLTDAQTSANNLFGERAIAPATASISGTVFKDSNGDGTRQSAEPGLSGWTVFADLNDNGKLDAGEPSAKTTSGGHYAINGLEPGGYTIRVVAQTRFKQTTPSVATQTIVATGQAGTGPLFGEVRVGPFSGTPAAFGRIQAENFDLGGQNTGYFNPGNTNRGGRYRPGEGVGIGAIPAADGGGFFVGWTLPGERLNYTVAVGTTAAYTLNFRVASQTKGGTFHLNVDGKNVTGELSIPATGDWNTYTIVSKAGVNLTAGTHVLQLVIDSAGPGTGVAGNFDWFEAVE
ncbi:MAG TPA: choice-of-anchor Q domain-containing protein [Humisphaera sp.]|nr:choice-of-anchor Q domain-containing protein [Humisphaera sp.]